MLLSFIKHRLSNHITEARSNKRTSHRIHWIVELLQLNLKPIVNLIATVHDDEWDFWEVFYIQLYKDLGYSLTNGTQGGDGFSPGHVPWNKGKATSEVTRQRIREKRKLQIISDNTKRKMSETKKGKVPSYMSEGKMPDSIKEKISNTLL